MVAYHHKWKPIEDLPRNLVWNGPELEPLRVAWRQHRAQLGEHKNLTEFNERLARSWSIETGVIERIYSIDRGTTQMLIERGLLVSLIEHGATDRPAAEVIAILKDHVDALEGLFDFVTHRRQLSISYIKELHQTLLRHQDSVDVVDQFGIKHPKPLLRGAWKQRPNNPSKPDGSIHEYCPPEQVQSELENLLAFYEKAVTSRVDPIVVASWLHHRFVQIHPFEDGNGRVARALSSLVLIQTDGFPLTVHRDKRGEYLDALECADRGDLSELISFFARIQARVYRRALAISATLRGKRSPAQIIEEAVGKFRSSQSALFPDIHDSNRVVALRDVAYGNLVSLAEVLKDRVKEVNQKFVARAEVSQVETAHDYDEMIYEIAEQQGYLADVSNFCAWARILIKDPRETHIVVAFHPAASEHSRLYACTAFILRPSQKGALFESGRPQVLHEDPFEFTPQDDQAPIEQKFKLWFDQVIVEALEHWLKRL